MADSMDRVFVHALSALKQMPKTGSTKPPVSDRLRLYGLYKQAMEGDVDGVMERPSRAVGITEDDLKREQAKWDSWNSHRSLSRTEAKRKYVEALVEILSRYATTPSGKELVSELEFVWDQVKNNTPSISDSSPYADSQHAHQTRPAIRHGNTAMMEPTEPSPLKVLRPMSEVDEADLASEQQLAYEDGLDYGDDDGDDISVLSGRWARRVEKALVKLSTEIVALREQISTAQEWRARQDG
ncbi:Autophagy-related protein 37 [Ceratocystis fimbriata CBS 114723]|uniref:Autophagy-related protein 37 n=1 Tax=Ceratocystis fimbriata CBS 114723 TaxID=1035309 RepID=A0A2C5X7F3_9PEZI|nr:Autophagy-related protein 37 [Ceratocystis fimbriata CBS 114723]